MTDLDLLSDDTYPQQAMKQVTNLLKSCDAFPVEPTQIYGLREIARQQPGQVAKFAKRQQNRAESKNYSGRFQSEIDFWQLVARLCEGSETDKDWSLQTEYQKQLPPDLRQVPEKRPKMTNEERRQRNQIKRERDQRVQQLLEEHIPVFFERFCTYCLYRRALMEEKS